MKNQAVWQKYTGKVAWPTIFLFLGLLIGYGFLWYAYKKGLGGWTSCIGAILAYGMFTIAHEACHSNISGGVKSFIFIEKTLGWVSSLFLMFPYCAFVIIHLRHHAHTNDPIKDPDNYVNGSNALSIFFRCTTLIGHYFGLTLGKDSKNDPAMKSIRGQSILFTFLIIFLMGTFIIIGEGYALLYVFILSALIAAPILAFSFDWIPHYPHHNTGKYHNTRVITIPGLEFVSLYQSYHLMHHLFPRVPFYKYKRCFLDYEKELLEKKSPIEGFRDQDAYLLKKKNTYTDLLTGKNWSYILEVGNVQVETHDTIRITFKNLDNIPFTFKAGQYVVISDDVQNEFISRCYSICESPSTGMLSVGVKRVSGGKLSNHLLDKVKRNYKLRVSGPYGNFVLPEKINTPLVLIAGGSGITPILSILKLVLTNSNIKVTLLYGCKSVKDVIFKKDLDQLSLLYPDQFSCIIELDILTEEKQCTHLEHLGSEMLCYICGPLPMMNASKRVLQKIGIADHQIMIEEFSFQRKQLSGKKHNIQSVLHQREISFFADSAETILEASIREKQELPYACGMGQCGTCKVKLDEGEVVWNTTTEIALLQNERDQGYILPCICRAKTNITLRS
ncbi:fatty acid desaturase [Aquimarina sp. AU474]|uniref:fatty acid desaturase n=1 Tax=Aquimarina sp. AU474 TaxID=2108529 RepID=UPI000D699CC0|nr:fatty acid desaturase [Aquimarina sp. AU474]